MKFPNSLFSIRTEISFFRFLCLGCLGCITPIFFQVPLSTRLLFGKLKLASKCIKYVEVSRIVSFDELNNLVINYWINFINNEKLNWSGFIFGFQLNYSSFVQRCIKVTTWTSFSWVWKYTLSKLIHFNTRCLLWSIKVFSTRIIIPFSSVSWEMQRTSPKKLSASTVRLFFSSLQLGK